MYGWLIALGIVILLAILPVGVMLIYNADGLILSLLFGLFRIRLLPKESKEKKEKKEKNNKSHKEPKKKTQKTANKSTDKKKSTGSITDFLPLLDIGLKLLNSFRKKLRVNQLEINYVMAGGDPCDLALNYAKAWETVGNVFPFLERVFVIKKRNVQVQCDFTADSARVYARLDITITIGRLIGMAVKYGVLALREFLKIKNKRKGGAHK